VRADAASLAGLLTHLAAEVCAARGAGQLIARVDLSLVDRVRVELTDRPATRADSPDAAPTPSEHIPEGAYTSACLWVPLATRRGTLVAPMEVDEADAPTDHGG
jgi:hypothetical protein